MADITVSGNVTDINRGVVSIRWEGFTASGSGTSFDASAYPDKSVQVYGTWASGNNSITLQGTNHPTSGATGYFTLHDPQGSALTFTTGGLKLIAENPRFIRPKCTSGTGSMDVDVVIIARGQPR